jgi:hypothetical protein
MVHENGKKAREAWQVGDTAPDLIELKLHNAVELHLRGGPKHCTGVYECIPFV